MLIYCFFSDLFYPGTSRFYHAKYTNTGGLGGLLHVFEVKERIDQKGTEARNANGMYFYVFLFMFLLFLIFWFCVHSALMTVKLKTQLRY